MLPPRSSDTILRNMLTAYSLKAREEFSQNVQVIFIDSLFTALVKPCKPPLIKCSVYQCRRSIYYLI